MNSEYVENVVVVNSVQSDYVEDINVDNNVNSEYVEENLNQIIDIRSQTNVNVSEKENIEDTAINVVNNTLMKYM